MSALVPTERTCGLMLRLLRRRIKLIVFVLFSLFLLNAFLISSYFQLQPSTSKEDVLPHELKAELQKLEADEKPKARVPRCSFPDTLADSAFNRMTTEVCRLQLEDVACDLDPAGWPVHEIENTCSKFDRSAYGQYKGCYEDSAKQRLLRGFKYEFTDSNTPDRCLQHCLRIGFQLAGVEYKSECFCGSLGDLEGGNLHEQQVECQRYPCPGNQSLPCGGFNALAVYTTGVVHNAKPIPAYVEPSGSARDVRILFLLQLNGRNSRQIRRLLRLIYSPRHFYFVHVDPRQKFMQQEMRDIQLLLEHQGHSNFHVSERQFPTIWGGSSLLEMFLYAVRWTLSHPAFQRWDYVFNLSESDFPVLSLAELEAVLSANKGKTFLSSHGYNTGTFLKKQGYNYHFMQCENRMWRFSARTNFPKFLRADGGSDWVIIAREFAKYAVSELELPTQMRKLFTSVLLPLEGFFHTLALNSEHCEQVLYNNLRFTNWKRSQGCRCGALKQVVDWCGCSPLALLHDEHKFELNRTISRVNYFARKFESLIDIDAVARAEAQVLRFEPQRVQLTSPAFHSIWVNHFDRRFDQGEFSHLFSHTPAAAPYSMLARVLFESAHVAGGCEFAQLVQIHAYKATRLADLLVVFRVEDTCGQVHEMLVDRQHRGQVFPDQTVDSYELLVVEFGMQLDLKEEIFRDFVSLLDRNGTAVFQFQWRNQQEEFVIKRNQTSPWALVQVVAPDGRVVKKERVKPYDSIDSMQHVNIDMKRIKDVNPGLYKMDILSQHGNKRVGVIEFPIFPAVLDDRFRQLALHFFVLKATCSTSGNEKKCAESTWSTDFPDEKQQIAALEMPDRAVLRQTLRSIAALVPDRIPADFDAARLKEIAGIVARISAEVLDVRLPPVGGERLRHEENVYSTDVHTSARFSTAIFGFRRAGGRIPLHDHLLNFGFIRVLRGRLRIRSFSWTNDPQAATARGDGLWRATFEGERVLGADGNEADSVAVLTPRVGNVHEVEALHDGTAFFDLLVPGYTNVVDCHYYEVVAEQKGGGDTPLAAGDSCWLRRVPSPSTYFTDLLDYPAVLKL
ncbi:Protein xylosyltransferase [Aphelenchoides fujianensis]|nr:Protein xylosyltransferase [Aphelenchoides fujianensis]